MSVEKFSCVNNPWLINALEGPKIPDQVAENSLTLGQSKSILYVPREVDHKGLRTFLS